jgi:hypothetical protein
MILTIRQATNGDWMLCSALPGNVTIARLKRNMKIEAQAIVRAVNAHESLVEAITECFDLIDQPDVRYLIGVKQGNMAQLHAAINKTRAALRKGE